MCEGILSFPEDLNLPGFEDSSRTTVSPTDTEGQLYLYLHPALGKAQLWGDLPGFGNKVYCPVTAFIPFFPKWLSCFGGRAGVD